MRVFPHRDWPPDSGTGRPHRTVDARPSLEGLESRALLSATTSLPIQPAYPAADDPRVAAEVAATPDLSSPRAGHAGYALAGDSVAPRSTTNTTQPEPLTPITSDGPWRWVIDSVTARPAPLDGDPPSSTAKATVDETGEIHDTLENAQILPASDDVQIRGTTVAGASADVYRVPVDVNTGSITVNLTNPGATPRGEKHLQLMDEMGNLYGDLKLSAPYSSLSISLYPRIPKSERMLYLGVFSISDDAGDDSTPDSYALTIIQQPADPTSIPADPPEQQTGPSPQTPASTSPLIGSLVPSIPADSQSAAPQSVALTVPISSESVELVSVVTQTGTMMSLPKLVVAPDGGILSMDEGNAAFEQQALTVDLALIELDSSGEAQGDLNLPLSGDTGEEEWTVELCRPAASLPLAMPTLEEYTPRPTVAATAAPPADLSSLPPAQADVLKEAAERKTRRWGLLQTGVGIASAVAFALLMPDAALMLHDPKFRVRRQSQGPANLRRKADALSGRS